MRKNSITVLVVDDESFSLQLMTMILEKQNYAVLTAQSGRQAVEMAQRQRPDLILLDVMMPEEDGFATCERLKRSPATADIPVIFISGMDDLSSKVRGLTIGGWDYITKPFQPLEVEARVKNCLKLRLAYQQIIEAQAMRLQQMHEAQQAILVDPAELPEANFHIHYLPIHEAGGDFYDVFPIAHDLFGYLVADVAGHDLSASFATSALKALVRQNASILYTPSETVRTINQILTSIFKEGQHLTAIYATLSRTHNTLAVVNAGHLPLLHLPLTGEPSWVEPNSDILGVFTDGAFECQTLKVSPGDRIYLFSDGLVESFQPARSREQGLAQLAAIAQDQRSAPLDQSTLAMLAALWPPGRQPEDDIVLLGISV